MRRLSDRQEWSVDCDGVAAREVWMWRRFANQSVEWIPFGPFDCFLTSVQASKWSFNLQGRNPRSTEVRPTHCHKHYSGSSPVSERNLFCFPNGRWECRRLKTRVEHSTVLCCRIWGISFVKWTRIVREDVAWGWPVKCANSWLLHSSRSLSCVIICQPPAAGEAEMWVAIHLAEAMPMKAEVPKFSAVCWNL